jgi:purine-nucleoside phosphorylase
MQNYSHVAKRLNIAPNTVKNVWLSKDEDEDLQKVVQEVANIKKESNEELLNHIKSSTYANITKNAMDLLTPDNLKLEVEQRGIKGLITLIGNSADKVLAVKDMDLKERAMSIRERELELKEMELKARIENPDAFSTVTIINDAPRHKGEEYAIAN